MSSLDVIYLPCRAHVCCQNEWNEARTELRMEDDYTRVKKVDFFVNNFVYLGTKIELKPQISGDLRATLAGNSMHGDIVYPEEAFEREFMER